MSERLCVLCGEDSEGQFTWLGGGGSTYLCRACAHRMAVPLCMALGVPYPSGDAYGIEITWDDVKRLSESMTYEINSCRLRLEATVDEVDVHRRFQELGLGGLVLTVKEARDE